MKWRLTLAVLLLLPLAAVCQFGGPVGSQPIGIRYSNIVTVSGGLPLPTIRICAEPATGTPCTPLAQIYSDRNLQFSLANPFTGDSSGNFSFYAAPGVYHAQVSGSGISTFEIPDIGLPSATAGSSPCTNDTITGTINTLLAKVTSTGTCVTTSTTDTAGAVGVVTFGGGTTGNAIITWGGLALASFDNVPVTLGDYACNSSTIAGDLTDCGTNPAGIQTVGKILAFVIGTEYTVLVNVDSRSSQAVGAVLLNPGGAQTVTQPVDTNLNLQFSGLGLLNISGNEAVSGSLSFTGAGSTLNLNSPFGLPAGTPCTQAALFTTGTLNTGLAQVSNSSWAWCSTGNEVADLYGSGIRLGNARALAFSSIVSANGTADLGVSREAPSLADFGNGSPLDFTALFRSGMTQQLLSDFTTAANTNLQTILTWSIPADQVRAPSFSFECKLTYSQATANVPFSFGIQAATNAPTRIDAAGRINTSASVFTTGVLRNLTTTTATAIVTATPSALATFFKAELDGTIQNPFGAANAINIMVSTSNSSDLVTVGAGSFCSFMP